MPLVGASVVYPVCCLFENHPVARYQLQITPSRTHSIFHQPSRRKNIEGSQLNQRLTAGCSSRPCFHLPGSTPHWVAPRFAHRTTWNPKVSNGKIGQPPRRIGARIEPGLPVAQRHPQRGDEVPLRGRGAVLKLQAGDQGGLHRDHLQRRIKSPPPHKKK